MSGEPQKYKLQWGKHRYKMLEAFATAPITGLTNEEAYLVTDIRRGAMFWCRCTELREMGYIRHIQEWRDTENGGTAQVNVITQDGMDVLRTVRERHEQKSA